MLTVGSVGACAYGLRCKRMLALHRSGQAPGFADADGMRERDRRACILCHRRKGVGLAGGGARAACAAPHRYGGRCARGRAHSRGQGAAKFRRRPRSRRPDRAAGGGDPAHRDRRHSFAVVHHAERRNRSGGARARGFLAKLRRRGHRQRDLGRHRDHDPDRHRGRRAANPLSRHLADLSGGSGGGGCDRGASVWIG